MIFKPCSMCYTPKRCKLKDSCKVSRELQHRTHYTMDTKWCCIEISTDGALTQNSIWLGTKQIAIEYGQKHFKFYLVGKRNDTIT